MESNGKTERTNNDFETSRVSLVTSDVLLNRGSPGLVGSKNTHLQGRELSNVASHLAWRLPYMRHVGIATQVLLEETLK